MSPGRIGNGAYFWTSLNDDQLPLATHLAASWARRSRENWNAFKDDTEQETAVVQVTVEAENDELLFLDDPEHHLDLRQELMDFAIKWFGLSSVFDITRDHVRQIKRRLYALIEGYIKLYEDELGGPVKLVFKSQIPPPDSRDPISEILGNASCFSIRDTTCIKNMYVSQI